MPAGNLDIVVEQGTDFSILFTVKDENAATIDLTGESYKAQMRPTYNSTELTADFVCTLLNQTTNKGQWTMTLAKSITQDIAIDVGIKKKNYFYDIDRTFADTHVERFLEGKAILHAEVTD